MDNVANKVLETKSKTSQFIKNKIFDVIAVGIVLAMTMLSLGVIELREINFEETVNMILECTPFYLAATMLTVDYYTKGTFSGKNTEAFINTSKLYSQVVTKLTGQQMNSIPSFCTYYNERVLRSKKEALLRSVAITWEVYNDGIDGKKPLKVLRKRDLDKLYGKEVRKVILNCNKLRIKGIYSNILLGNIVSDDDTDLGENEKQLARRRTGKYAAGYAMSILFMSLIAVKNVVQWGWMGAFLTLFKVLYIACSAYMKYFDGYQDITVNIVNHMNRKMDVLKEFDYWYESTCKSCIECESEVTK